MSEKKKVSEAQLAALAKAREKAAEKAKESKEVVYTLSEAQFKTFMDKLDEISTKLSAAVDKLPSKMSTDWLKKG